MTIPGPSLMTSSSASSSSSTATPRAPTDLYLIVGPKPTVRRTLSFMLSGRPKGQHWAIVLDEVGLLDYDALPKGEAAKEVQWRELFGGCSCCVAAASPVLRTTVAHLMRGTPRPRRFLLVLSQDAEASRLIPTLGRYFKNAAPLQAIIMCTDLSSHRFLMARAEGGSDGRDHEHDEDGNRI
jgi:hypothetical protein